MVVPECYVLIAFSHRENAEAVVKYINAIQSENGTEGIVTSGEFACLLVDPNEVRIAGITQEGAKL